MNNVTISTVIYHLIDLFLQYGERLANLIVALNILFCLLGIKSTLKINIKRSSKEMNY
jgi:hypothetical protein